MAQPRMFFTRCRMSPAVSPGKLRPLPCTQSRNVHAASTRRQQQWKLVSRTPVTTTAAQRHYYHSELHPAIPLHEYTNSQTAILGAALEHVPQHGFTHDALILGARDTGFLDVSVQLLPRGEFDLVLFWLASRRGLLGTKAEEENNLMNDDLDYSVADKAQWLVMERLMMNEKVKDQWQGVCTYIYIYTLFFFFFFFFFFFIHLF